MLLPSIQTEIRWDNKKELQSDIYCKYIPCSYACIIACCYNVRLSKLLEIYQGENSVYNFSVKCLKNVRVWRNYDENLSKKY